MDLDEAPARPPCSPPARRHDDTAVLVTSVGIFSGRVLRDARRPSPPQLPVPSQAARVAVITRWTLPPSPRPSCGHPIEWLPYLCPETRPAPRRSVEWLSSKGGWLDGSVQRESALEHVVVHSNSRTWSATFQLILPGAQRTPQLVSPTAPQAEMFCTVDGTVPEQIEGANNDYEMIAGAELNCVGGTASDIRFSGCIEHSQNGSTAWGEDGDSCTVVYPGGDLHAKGAPEVSADHTYVHTCVRGGALWYYRLRWMIRGTYDVGGYPLYSAEPPGTFTYTANSRRVSC